LLGCCWAVLGFFYISFAEMFLIVIFNSQYGLLWAFCVLLFYENILIGLFLYFFIWCFLYYIIFTKKMRDYSLFDDLILLVQSLLGYELSVQSVSLCCLLRKSDRFFCLNMSVFFCLRVSIWYVENLTDFNRQNLSPDN